MTKIGAFVVGWIIWFFAWEVSIAQDKELKLVVAELIQKMSSSTVEAHKGSMNFVIDNVSSTGSVRYVGKIRWDYPDIRWDFEEQHFVGQDKLDAKVSKIVIDSPAEIITINKTSRHAFRSVQRARNYESGLRIAPWQIWTEFDDIPFSELFDVDKIISSGRQLKGGREGSKYSLELIAENGKAKGNFKFDSATGLPLDVWCTGLGPGVGQKIDWIEKDGVSFPHRAQYTRLKDGVGKPYLKLTTSGHSKMSSLTTDECSMKAITRADVDLLTTFRSGQKSVTSKFTYGKTSTGATNEMLRRLGTQEGRIGFARNRD